MRGEHLRIQNRGGLQNHVAKLGFDYTKFCIGAVAGLSVTSIRLLLKKDGKMPRHETVKKWLAVYKEEQGNDTRT